MALFIGAARDPHLQIARDLLHELNLTCVILDPEDPCELSIEFNPFIVRINGAVIDPVVIWWRWKEALMERATSDLDPVAVSEWRGVGQAIRYRYADRCVHAPDALNIAGQKLLQLGFAKAAGFNVPASLASNDRAKIQEFLQSESVIKSISTPQVFTADGFTPFDTQKLDGELLDRIGDANLRSGPSFLQRFIDRSAEVRVAYVCGEVTAVRYSPSKALEFDPDVHADWRAMYRYADLGLVESERIELPAAVRRSIDAYAAMSDMRLLSFDFAVDRSDRFVFLEANPDGQWTWVDKDRSLMKRFVDWIAAEHQRLAA